MGIYVGKTDDEKEFFEILISIDPMKSPIAVRS